MEKDKLIKNIKNGGSLAIYVGTASIVKPIVKEHIQDRNGFTKACSIFSGTVISCGISALASRWFNKIVDKVGDFVEDVKNPKPRSNTDAKN